MSISNATRIKIERRITAKVVDALLAAGFEITVNSDRGYGKHEINRSRDREAIIEATRSSDEDVIMVAKPGDKHEDGVGWVDLIYGNGEALIHDYTLGLDPIMVPVQAWIDEQGFIG